MHMRANISIIASLVLIFMVAGCARTRTVRRAPSAAHDDQIQATEEVDGAAGGEDPTQLDGGVDAATGEGGEPPEPLGRICLDPGHPSREGDRLYEAVINRKVAFYAKELLEGEGYEVWLTTTDVTPEELFSPEFDNEGNAEQSRMEVVSLEDRAEACNQWNGEYLISIHHNKATDTERNITAVYYGQDAQFRPWHDAAPVWAELTGEQLYTAMETTSKKVGGDQGSIGFSLTVLELVDAVGILTEASFYTHPEERIRLNQNSYLHGEAEAIVDGFLQFVAGN